MLYTTWGQISQQKYDSYDWSQIMMALKMYISISLNQLGKLWDIGEKSMGHEELKIEDRKQIT